jgi:hypothetical protein
MTTGLLGLSADDYWETPWKNALQLHERYVLGEKWGIYIDAPSLIDPAVRNSIPTPFLYVAQRREAAKIDLERMAKVVASRFEDRAFFINTAVPASEYKSADEPRVGKDSTDPTSTKYTLDLETQLRLLNKPGTYKVVVLLQQQMSNIVETKIEPSPVPVEELHFPDPPSPELLKSFEGAPETPGEPGMIMSVDRVVLDVAGSTAPLKVSFRIPVLNRERVPEPLPWLVFGESFYPDYGTPRPFAILPITLVIFSSGDAVATVIPLRVPVFTESAIGSFAVDLLSSPHVRGHARAYYIYAFCGEFVAGPAIMATVTEDMLPKPRVE